MQTLGSSDGRPQQVPVQPDCEMPSPRHIKQGDRSRSIMPVFLDEKTALPARRLRKIASEIFEGESRLTDHDAYDLRAALKMDTSVSFSNTKKTTKPKNKKLPGVRDPKRDPVGRTGS